MFRSTLAPLWKFIKYMTKNMGENEENLVQVTWSSIHLGTKKPIIICYPTHHCTSRNRTAVLKDEYYWKRIFVGEDWLWIWIDFDMGANYFVLSQVCWQLRGCWLVIPLCMANWIFWRVMMSLICTFIKTKIAKKKLEWQKVIILSKNILQIRRICIIKFFLNSAYHILCALLINEWTY